MVQESHPMSPHGSHFLRGDPLKVPQPLQLTENCAGRTKNQEVDVKSVQQVQREADALLV